jgi:hypothetical protein
MTIDEIYKVPFESIHILDLKKIEIVNIITVTNRIYARWDLITKEYFQNDTRWIPIIMLFNNISNPVEINIGSILMIPDINTLQSQLVVMHNSENEVPGVIKFTDNSRVNSELSKGNQNATQTTALPKLNITVDKIKYDPKTGIIIL